MTVIYVVQLLDDTRGLMVSHYGECVAQGIGQCVSADHVSYFYDFSIRQYDCFSFLFLERDSIFFTTNKSIS